MALERGLEKALKQAYIVNVSNGMEILLWGIHMARRSKGLRSRSRGKQTKHVREHGLSPISRAIQDLSVGTKVSIILDPGVVKGQPHHRYHGRIGVVRERRGRAYVVEVRDGGSMKKIISRPEHIRVVGQ